MLRITGIDCATDPSRVGLALGTAGATGVSLQEVVPCKSQNDVLTIVTNWIEHGSPIILALDAPLGWPRLLGNSLPKHRAGERLDGDPGYLFARATDLFIASKLKKAPLEVGANLIARTAHWALLFLCDLRERTGQELPLLWEQGRTSTSGVIEVYPAASLRSGYLSNLPRYSRRNDSQARSQLVGWLSGEMDLQGLNEDLISSPHLLDAAVCVLAGGDFIACNCWPPQNNELARKEGWIWTRQRNDT